MKIINLDDINMGEKAYISEIYLEKSIRGRLRDFGFSKGAKIELCGESILKDPKAFLVKGAVIAIRRKDCRGIAVKRSEGG